MLFGLGKGKNKDSSKRSADKASAAKRSGSGASQRDRRFGLKSSKARAKLKSGGSMGGNVNKLFHGVAVRARNDACCGAVKALGTQRFLSEEAPLLPLADCSNPQGCRCVYEHFDERRDNLRRETDVGMPVRTHPEEKRVGHGRRITDG